MSVQSKMLLDKNKKTKLSKVWINKSVIKGQRNARAKTKESIFGTFQHAP